MDEPAVARSRQRWLVTAVFASVICVDQAGKWLAWRSLDGSLINSGGYLLLGPVIRSWFASPVSGAVADVIASAALVAAVGRLLCRRRSVEVLLGGGLVAAGCASNLLDRLGVHNWSAPGSARGVVDFIPSGGASRCNLADLGIVGGAMLLAYTLMHRRTAEEQGDIVAAPAESRSSTHARSAVRIAALIALLAVITLAVAGAMDHQGVYEPAAKAAIHPL